MSDVSIVAKYRTEEILATIQAFRKLDYTDERLYSSGLLRDAVESHFWLMENSGKSLDTVFIEMKISIDSMITKLVKDENKLNEITDYLFDYLNYLESSFLIASITNFHSKFTEKETNKKYYFLDNGILGLFLTDQPTKLLENQIYIELRRRGDNPFFS